jgi:hypothetical protein
MKVILNEKQYNTYKNFLLENITDEGRNLINTKGGKIIRDKEEELRKKLFSPEELGKTNISQTKQYQLNDYPVKNDIQLASGLFSIGNAKLSDDTIIINFTSALECPSVGLCPVTQMACYAVAGEMRLPTVRRKNLMVQNMWARAVSNNIIGEVFGIAETYIEISQKTRKPIKYVRFNEAGDFPMDKQQRILDAAALFAQRMKEMYGVQSMAYTSNSKLNYKKEINGEPIYKIIKINASRLDIDLGDSERMNFLATPMDFKTVLEDNDKVISINDSTLKELRYQCEGVLNDPKTNTPSIPVLTKGNWGGGEKWYYVCPCSFWRFNKDKATIAFLKKMKKIPNNVDYLDTKELKKIIKTLSESEKNAIKKETNEIKSPCGTKCAVCHNTSGGVTKETSKYGPEHWKIIKEYTVLESVHGATSSKYKENYAVAKRNGNDNVKYTDANPSGMVKKYKKV